MDFGIHRDVIINIIESCDYKKYLELGVCKGEILSSLTKSGVDAYGVDIVDNRLDKTTKLYKMTTVDFFAQNSMNYDAIFIDASHKIEDLLLDLQNSLKVLNPNGIIMLHDTDPITCNLFNENGDLCGDAIKINTMSFPDNFFDYKISMVTLPIGDEGLTFIRRKNETRIII